MMQKAESLICLPMNIRLWTRPPLDTANKDDITRMNLILENLEQAINAADANLVAIGMLDK